MVGANSDTFKLDNGRGEAEFFYRRYTVTSETWNSIIPRKKNTTKKT